MKKKNQPTLKRLHYGKNLMVKKLIINGLTKEK